MCHEAVNVISDCLFLEDANVDTCFMGSTDIQHVYAQLTHPTVGHPVTHCASCFIFNITKLVSIKLVIAGSRQRLCEI